jgi:hypothetical protein
MKTSLQCPNVRTLIVLFAVAALAPPVVTRLSAQERALSPTLLRVLGETAAACRPGPRAIYLVADYRFPHEVVGHFFSRPEAERIRERSGSTFGVFGPYTAGRDVSDTAVRALTVTITRRATSGRIDTISVDPQKVDALFLSMSAVDKFMLPYYSNLYGPEYAFRLRQRLGPSSILPCHTKSRPCYPAPDGSLQIVHVMDPRPVDSVGPAQR